jgi:uncharacterized protein (DUF2132 family)
MADEQPDNPLHGITLEMMLNQLVAQYGWAELGNRIPVRCFTENPSLMRNTGYEAKDQARGVPLRRLQSSEGKLRSPR